MPKLDKYLLKIVIAVLYTTSNSVHSSYFTNSIGMSFEYIPSGSFVMGSCTQYNLCDVNSVVDVDASIDESPEHHVIISKNFLIGTYEVLIEEYMKFIFDNGMPFIADFYFFLNNIHNQKSAVSYVSWHDANNFINWLNRKENCSCYRLATEAEWEYVAKSDSIDFYYSKKQHVGEYAWYDKNSKSIGNNRSHIVGLKMPNSFGVYDMQGNVWEWVQDWYGNSYYSNSQNTDPLGPNIGKEKVDRGGAWNNNVNLLRPANRSSTNPEKRLNYLGFRIVKEI
jgi:formylglycine-generating enzyme required for sulfatase activity